MIGREPTGAEIDEHKWHGEGYQNDNMSSRGTFIGALLLMLSCVVGFILGMIVRGFLCG